MRYVLQLLQQGRQYRIRLNGLADLLKLSSRNVFNFLNKVKNLGITDDMSVVVKSKLAIFNQLNFFQFITGILVPFIGLFGAEKFPFTGWIIICLPALVSVLVLILNHHRKHELALLTYFVLYPFFICVNYINGISLGIELSFILYGILSVFFIQDIGYMIFSISFSMISYFFLSVILKKYIFQLEQINFVAYLINQALAIIYIFYGLYLIKTENANYNRALYDTNVEIQKQSNQLQEQASELDQLNSLKNKLFSVISHDLKAPMYALRNLFESMHSQDMPAEDIKSMIPDIKQDLNYTVSLMENLLTWAKSQMQSHSVRPQAVDMRDLIDDVVHVLHLQADAKNIRIVNKSTQPVHAWADADMIHLVLRNLISNAIKFTPDGGTITVGAQEKAGAGVEIYVADTGIGMSRAQIEKAFSVYGQVDSRIARTHEGTGLGLPISQSLARLQGGDLLAQSIPGQGTRMTFVLPESRIVRPGIEAIAV